VIKFYHECVVLSYHAVAIGILALLFFGMRLEKWRYSRISSRHWKMIREQMTPEEMKDIEEEIRDRRARKN